MACYKHKMYYLANYAHQEFSEIQHTRFLAYIICYQLSVVFMFLTLRTVTRLIHVLQCEHYNEKVEVSL